MTTMAERQIEQVTLIGSLGRDQNWFKLPVTVMSDVGPATQTLAGLLKMTNKETFATANTIAEAARLPLKTVRKHLVTLHEKGWITNEGRQKTRAGIPRRTCTIKVTKQARDLMKPYLVLPWWACCSIKKIGRLHWSTKAVLAVVMSRLCELKAVVEREGESADEEDLIGGIENLGGDERFAFSLDYLESQTGLTRDSIAVAKRRLANLKIVSWHYQHDPHAAHLLAPNHDFRVVVTPAAEGRCYISFGGSKSGQ